MKWGGEIREILQKESTECFRLQANLTTKVQLRELTKEYQRVGESLRVAEAKHNRECKESARQRVVLKDTDRLFLYSPRGRVCVLGGLGVLSTHGDPKDRG